MENFNALTTKEHLRSEIIAWNAAYAVLGTMVTIINALTLHVFIRTKSLRTRKHVMAINLVVTDLLYGAVALPCSQAVLLEPSLVSYNVFQALNAFTKTASLFTLGVIAVERMHATIWPIRHQVMNNIVYKIALVVIWGLSAVITTIVIICQSGLLEKTLLSNLLLPVVILLITFTIVSCYVSIWISFRRRKHRKRGTAAAKRDKALAITLCLVAGAFLVFWAISMLYLSVSQLEICKNCYQPTVTLFRYTRILTSVQSIFNPVIYCFGLPAFKASLKVRVEDIKCSRAEGFGSRRNPGQSQTSKEIEIVNAERNKVNEGTL